MQLEYCQRILLAVELFCFGAAVAVARRAAAMSPLLTYSLAFMI